MDGPLPTGCHPDSNAGKYRGAPEPIGGFLNVVRFFEPAGSPERERWLANLLTTVSPLPGCEPPLPTSTLHDPRLHGAVPRGGASGRDRTILHVGRVGERAPKIVFGVDIGEGARASKWVEIGRGRSEHEGHAEVDDEARGRTRRLDGGSRVAVGDLVKIHVLGCISITAAHSHSRPRSTGPRCTGVARTAARNRHAPGPISRRGRCRPSNIRERASSAVANSAARQLQAVGALARVAADGVRRRANTTRGFNRSASGRDRRAAAANAG